MLVKELIEILQSYPENFKVKTLDPDTDWLLDIKYVGDDIKKINQITLKVHNPEDFEKNCVCIVTTYPD